MSRREIAAQLTRAAIHEAGHAVVMLAVGIPVTGVEAGVHRPMFGAPQAAGFTRGEDDASPLTLPRKRLIQVAATWLAGVEAEARYAHLNAGEPLSRARERAIRAYGRTGGGDMAEVRSFCRHLGWFSRGEVDRAAERLVRAHWSAIERVAAELEKRGRLTQAQLSWLM